MMTLDLETHPEWQPLMAELGPEALVIRMGGKPFAYVEKAKPADLFHFRRDMRSPIYAGNSVVDMRSEDVR